MRRVLVLLLCGQLAFAHPFDVPQEPDRKRSVIGPPLLSFVLPGFDQWTEGQYGWGAGYSGVAVAGAQLMRFSDGNPGINTYNDRDRLATLGAQIFQTSGGFSAYHSFRTAVRTRKPHGEYSFLTHEETPGDLMLAPFRFDFITRPTTFAPLLALTGLLVVAAKVSKPPPRVHLTATDAAFTFAFSYNAGTHEEAVFRGWMMPVWMHYVNNEILSNLFTSVLFAAAHFSPSNPIPWPQFLVGFYLGQVTQWREWTLAESIFIHTWYDVIAIGALYGLRDQAQLNIQLPPLVVRF